LLRKVTDFEFDSVIEDLSDITSISLDFSQFPDITDSGFSKIRQALSKLQELRSINLNLEGDRQSPTRTLTKWSEIIATLLNITSISIKFGSNGIDDVGLETLSDALKKLESLYSITIDFVNNDEITEEGWMHLTDVFRFHPSLVSINLAGTLHISDKSLAILSEALSNLQSLTSLTLQFDVQNEVSDIGWASLSKGLTKLKRLQSLAVQFGKEQSLTDVGLIKFSETFRDYLTNLASLSLDIPENEKNYRHCKYRVHYISCWPQEIVHN